MLSLRARCSPGGCRVVVRQVAARAEAAHDPGRSRRSGAISFAPRTKTLSCARHNRSASAIRRDALEMGVCTIGIPAG